MTEQKIGTELKSISDSELIEKAESYIIKLAETHGKSFRTSIPPNKHDTDMLLMELVNRYKTLNSTLDSNIK